MFTKKMLAIRRMKFFPSTPVTGVLISRSFTSTKRSVENLLGLPEKPKKPASPFMQYAMEIMKESGHGGEKIKERFKKFSELWKNASPEDKARIYQKYVDQLSVYKEQIKIYNESLSPEQKKNLLIAKKDLTATKKIRMEEKTCGRPMRPPSSFSKFVSEKLSENKNLKIKEKAMTGLSSIWNNMSQEEKKKYQDMADAARAEYKEALVKWQAEMIRTGKGHLLVMSPLGKRKAPRKNEISSSPNSP